MKKLISFIFGIIATSMFLNAQINDSYVLTASDLTIEQIGEYHIISNIETSYTDEIGNPQLLVKNVSFVLPYESTITELEITSSTQQLDGIFYIFPVQPPIPLNGSDPPPFAEPSPLIYNSNSPYPAKSAEIISDEYMHGYHVVTIAIYPIEYHPAKGEVYLRNINFTINYTNAFDTNNITFEKQSRKRYELGRQFVQGLVKNSNDVENCRNFKAQIIYNDSNYDENKPDKSGSTSAIDMHIPDYIIITNNELKSKFQTLANWKTRKGVPAIIKTIEEIQQDYQGSDLQEKIRNYLKEVYGRWGASLFVLLGGDDNIVPARLFRATSYATDLYYATVDGNWNANNNDLFGEQSDETDNGYDFFLGRASVENIAEAQTFINKVIAYEKYSNLGNNSYVNNYLCLSGFLSDNKCRVFYDGYFDEHKDIASNNMAANIAVPLKFKIAL
jgi:hypothetical protein